VLRRRCRYFFAAKEQLCRRIFKKESKKISDEKIAIIFRDGVSSVLVNDRQTK
jgi:hypothetical protein